MFFNNRWNVLIVDDEPDVLSLSRLMMRSFSVYGVPLDIYAAQSMDEALHVLEKQMLTVAGWSSLAAAFIDVVMETDTAGLDLCHHIRDVMQNNITQLFIRTGQPGMAPEREVIDRYDITGYLTKIEATEEKLYALTKTCIRQYRWVATERWTLNAIGAIVAGRGSRERIMKNTLRHFRETLLPLAGGANEYQNIQAALLVDGEPLLSLDLSEDDLASLPCNLEEQTAVPLSEDGDYFAVNVARELMIRIPGRKNNADLLFIGKGANDAPGFVFRSVHAWLRALAVLWDQAS
nr:response regulator receiver protein [Anaerolineae bacterium]